MKDNEQLNAYVAGVLDGGSSIRVRIQRARSHSVGYQIVLLIRVKRKNKELPELLADWSGQIGVLSTAEKEGDYYVWRVKRRDQVEDILKRIEPYLEIYDDVAEIILTEIIPRMEDKDHTSKTGFVELMEYADRVRKATPTRGTTKYDAEFFRDLWDEVEGDI